MSNGVRSSEESSIIGRQDSLRQSSAKILAETRNFVILRLDSCWRWAEIQGMSHLYCKSQQIALSQDCRHNLARVDTDVFTLDSRGCLSYEKEGGVSSQRVYHSMVRPILTISHSSIIDPNGRHGVELLPYQQLASGSSAPLKVSLCVETPRSDDKRLEVCSKSIWPGQKRVRQCRRSYSIRDLETESLSTYCFASLSGAA